MVKLTAITVPECAAVTLRIGLEARQIDDREFGREAFHADPAFGSIRSCCMNSECQAYSVTMRTGRRCVEIGAAEQILHEQLAALRVGHHGRHRARRNAAGVIALLLSHQTWASLAASRTTNLSPADARCAGR